MKDAYYFSHDSNARFDTKIIKLRAKYGLEGYGFYFCLLEIMRDSSNYCFDLTDTNTLSFQMQINQDKVEEILKYCREIELFETDGILLYSESFLSRMEQMDELRAKRREAGRKGGKAKAKLKQTSSKNLALKEKKGKEKKGNNDKEIKEEFNIWYSKYPLKKSKDTALKKFISIREDGISLEELINGLDGYIRELKLKNTEDKFIKHPSTWLNQCCWNDEYIKPERKKAYNGML